MRQTENRPRYASAEKADGDRPPVLDALLANITPIGIAM